MMKRVPDFPDEESIVGVDDVEEENNTRPGYPLRYFLCCLQNLFSSIYTASNEPLMPT